MKKNELVHFHTLLWQLASESVEQGRARPEAFEAYRQLAISPVDLRASRDEHERAVSLLAATLAACVRDETHAAAA